MNFDDYPLDAHTCQFQVGSCKFGRSHFSFFQGNNLILCVPGIVAFIPKNIEPLFFFSSYSLCLNRLSWEFTKKLRPEPICWRAFVFPACFCDSRHAFFYFIRVTIPGTLCRIDFFCKNCISLDWIKRCFDKNACFILADTILKNICLL